MEIKRPKLKDFDSGRGFEYDWRDYENYRKAKREYIKNKKLKQVK